VKCYPRKQIKKYLGVALIVALIVGMASCGMLGERADNVVEATSTGAGGAVGGATGAAVAGPGGAGVGAFLGALMGWLFGGGPEEPPAPPASPWDALVASTEMLTTLAIIAAILLLVPSPVGLLKRLRNRAKRILE